MSFTVREIVEHFNIKTKFNDFLLDAEIDVDEMFDECIYIKDMKAYKCYYLEDPDRKFLMVYPKAKNNDTAVALLSGILGEFPIGWGYTAYGFPCEF